MRVAVTYSGVSRVRADLQAERWVTGEWTARKVFIISEVGEFGVSGEIGRRD